ncbi:hypothetical protein U1Q18_052631 [Sarracenia purpurea var. burkii]
MIVTSVHQTHLVPQEDLPQSPDCNFRSREQECVSLIKKCKNLEEFKQVHAQILKLGMFWSSFCASNLLATCSLSDWGSMDYACSIFRLIEEPGSFAFNNMIRGHVRDMNLEEAVLMYDEMLECGVGPDNFTYPTLLKACANLPAIEEGMQIHGHIFKLGFEDDVFVQNSLVSMYGKCGEITLSRAVFEKMEQRSVASWSALIAAHASLGMWCECLEIFGDMTSEGFWRAEESILVNVLSACTHLGALHLGKCAHESLTRTIGGLNVTLETSLIDMYIKCGCINKGLILFQRMAKKNHMSYSVMISGLAMHGRGLDALKVFSKMLEQGLEPDDVTYVGVLSACSHGGFIEEGLRCFERMKLDHGIVPTVQHYGCMVDLMGRAGKLNEAYEFIKNMPIDPNEVLWRTLLSACKVHQNVEMGEVAAKRLFLLNSHTASDYVVLSNMYAQAQRWHDVAKIRKEMVYRGLMQTLGFSFVEVKRKVFKFVSQDLSSPQCDGIHEMIQQMEWQLRFEGYSPDTSQVLLNVDVEEKRHRLRSHSQKLAIAFALIHTSHGSPIRIVRNVRMCSDCHKYTKLISTIYKREITVRDQNQFHHFKEGTCSCRDFW